MFCRGLCCADLARTSQQQLGKKSSGWNVLERMFIWGQHGGERAGAHSQRPTRLGRALISPEVLGSRLYVVTRGLQCLGGVGEEHGGPCGPSWGPADSGHGGMFIRAGRAPRDSQSRGPK